MKSIREKYCCGNCDFWEFDPALQPTGGSAIKLADTGKAPHYRCGRCRKDPPQMMAVPVQSALDPRQIQLRQERMFPLTTENEFCSHHASFRTDTLRGLVSTCFHAWDNRLAYKPGEIPDTVAAGFNRPPTLDEAKKIAFGADAKPGDPVPPARDEKL